jgi:hypothetical protein
MCLTGFAGCSGCCDGADEVGSVDTDGSGTACAAAAPALTPLVPAEIPLTGAKLTGGWGWEAEISETIGTGRAEDVVEGWLGVTDISSRDTHAMHTTGTYSPEWKTRQEKPGQSSAMKMGPAPKLRYVCGHGPVAKDRMRIRISRGKKCYESHLTWSRQVGR